MTTVATLLTLRFGATTWDVPVGKVFRFGRHAANDVVIDDPRVSRFHAQITWQGETPVVADLDSLNGTTLDGARLAHGAHVLEHGSLLGVGNVLEMTVEVHAPEGPPALVPDDETEGLTFFTEWDAKPFEGNFARQEDLHRALLDLEWEQRTGTVELTLGARRASVTFCMGRVVRARHRNLQGLQALERLLRATVGHWRFRPQVQANDEEALGLSLRHYLRQGQWGATRRHVRAA